MFISHRISPYKERPIFKYHTFDQMGVKSDMITLEDAHGMDITLTFFSSQRLRIIQELESLLKMLDSQTDEEEAHNDNK